MGAPLPASLLRRAPSSMPRVSIPPSCGSSRHAPAVVSRRRRPPRSTRPPLIHRPARGRCRTPRSRFRPRRATATRARHRARSTARPVRRAPRRHRACPAARARRETSRWRVRNPRPPPHSCARRPACARRARSRRCRRCERPCHHRVGVEDEHPRDADVSWYGARGTPSWRRTRIAVVVPTPKRSSASVRSARARHRAGAGRARPPARRGIAGARVRARAARCH